MMNREKLANNYIDMERIANSYHLVGEHGKGQETYFSVSWTKVH